MAQGAASTWKPYDKLTIAPTNLKEAIDWVLRVTGRDGKKNEKGSNGPHCLCYLAKAIKDLLYDAKDPGTPGPSPERNWDDILLEQEKTIVHPLLTDLGLVTSGSTSAASTTCAGGTEVIRTLIDHLALGLQKWVGWQDKVDECCLKGADGIGKGCTCSNVGSAGQCCNSGSPGCTCATSGQKCSYKSAYDKQNALWTNIVNGTTDAGGSGSAGSAVGGKGGSGVASTPVDPVKAAQEVHLLARIFLGSVCLIWSGLSQLGFLTGGGRWENSSLHEITGNGNDGLGSFMAAMGYDLDRLNHGGPGKGGEFVWKLLSGQAPSDDKNKIKWNEFKNGNPSSESVAEYYSSIYSTAEKTLSGQKTESICKQYPLLVLHILASGYFRAGSAGAKNVILAPPSAAQAALTAEKKETPSPRKPRTIREILYWLSALPYSEKYKALVERMKGKMKEILPKDETQKLEDKIDLHGEGNSMTHLKKDCITHYILAACGYCPLVLIGIQGTIATSGNDSAPAAGPGGASGSSAEKNRCPEHKKKPSSKRCIYDDKKAQEAAKAAPAPASTGGEPLKEGEVCYGGYHLEVSKFGPLHGMYANGLYGFDLDGSAAQCLDQLRIYVYHCFYQLYFLRKQCKEGVVGTDKAVLGWKSCRYGNGVAKRTGGNNRWMCDPLREGANKGEHGTPGKGSPLQSFLCDGFWLLACDKTKAASLDKYPSIEEHMNKTVDSKGIEQGPHRYYPQICPVPMGWSMETTNGENHFKDLSKTHKQTALQGAANAAATSSTGTGGVAATGVAASGVVPSQSTYPAHCTGNTLSHLLEYYCDPDKCHGTLVVLLRLLACITPTVPRTLGDLFGFYYYVVYIGGIQGGKKEVYEKLQKELQDALTTWKNGGNCSGGTQGTLKCLYGNSSNCTPFLSPLSGQQYGQLSPLMAGTYLSWLVYLIEEFHDGLDKLKEEFTKISCKDSDCKSKAGAASGCSNTCHKPTGGNNQCTCCCASVVSCTGVLPVLYKYGFGYGNVETLHKTPGEKKCHDFLGTLNKVEGSTEFSQLTNSINQLIYTTRLPWIFVLTVAWLVAVLYLAFGAIWPLDWTHMRSHCRGWFRKGSLSPWEILMVGKKKGRGILEFFGRR